MRAVVRAAAVALLLVPASGVTLAQPGSTRPKYLLARVGFIANENEAFNWGRQIGYKLDSGVRDKYEPTRRSYDELRDERTVNAEVVQIQATQEGRVTKFVVTFYHSDVAMFDVIPCGTVTAQECAVSTVRLERIVKAIGDHITCHEGSTPCNPINQRAAF